jgi:hypothetical protein
MRCVERSRPSASTITISPPVGAMPISRSRLSRMTGRLRNWTTPSTGASCDDCSETCAAPPMWKVRIVSCVPGSPIDCAAITPTASPMLTGVPRARSRP